MNILWTYWNSLNNAWKCVLFKEWFFFVKEKQSLNIFLCDDSYGLDFLICHFLGMESNNPEEDLNRLSNYIKESISQIDEEVLIEIFDMEFLALDETISFLTPLQWFRNIKVLDFHGTNNSKITDFNDLKRDSTIYILDYADYQLVNFDEFSNIKQIPNLVYIKEYGWPNELDNILKLLTNYNLD